MQQLQYLNRKFQLQQNKHFRKPLKQFKINNDTYIFKTSHLSLILYGILILINIIGYLYIPTVLLFGIILPLSFIYKRRYIAHQYWMFVTILLFIRLNTMYLSFLDSIILIVLWHPNINWSQKIISKLAELTNKSKERVNPIVYYRNYSQINEFYDERDPNVRIRSYPTAFY